MTDLAGALADTSKLSSYRGRDVIRTKIAVRNAGDGLSEGMKIDPAELEQGSKVYVVLECEVGAHTHKPIEDTDALELVQVLKAGAATLIDGEVVREAIEHQKQKIEVAKERAAGMSSLAEGHDEEDDEVAVLRRQHFAGLHSDELREGCPVCDEERAAEEDGD